MTYDDWKTRDDTFDDDCDPWGDSNLMEDPQIAEFENHLDQLLQEAETAHDFAVIAQLEREFHAARNGYEFWDAYSTGTWMAGADYWAASWIKF